MSTFSLIAKDFNGFPAEELGKSWGIAFSGGGARAQAFTVGILQSINDAGLLEKVPIISANSGGTWAMVPLAYENVTPGAAASPSIDEYLGKGSISVLICRRTY